MTVNPSLTLPPSAIDETRDGLHVRLPAALAAIDAVDDLVAAWLTRMAVAVDLFAVRIVLREALLNAVLHGCGADERLTVELDLACGHDGLTISIADPGEGFELHSLGALNVTGDGGRGIPLMRLYTDAVTYSEHGTQVRLFKRYAATPGDDTPKGDSHV